jgi:hypothetical protein
VLVGVKALQVRKVLMEVKLVRVKAGWRHARFLHINFPGGGRYELGAKAAA